MQLTEFPCVHLVVGGWYLDCSRGFDHDTEEPLYNNLTCFAPKVIELEEEQEEDENPTPPTNDKEVALVKGNGKGKRVASNQMSTCSLTKASIQCTAALVTTVVGSPTAIPFVPSRDHVPAPSHSGVTIPSVPRKRKAVTPDTSTTSSEKSSSLFLIKNVDMGDLIADLMPSKVPHPAYCPIQEFLTTVCAIFSYFPVHSL